MIEAQNERIVSNIRVVSTLGPSYVIVASSYSDFFLHPVFLRFFATCMFIAIFARESAASLYMDNWQIVTVWSTNAAAILLWIWLVHRVVRLRLRNGYTPTVYTPFILVPLTLLLDIVTYSLWDVLLHKSWPDLPSILATFTVNAGVVLLFDDLHSRYVVHLHPNALTEHNRPSLPQPAPVWSPAPGVPPVTIDEPAAVSLAEPSVAPANTRAAPEGGAMVQIGNQSFRLADIITIRTEDHYLGIQTAKGKFMQRAKLSEVAGLHGSDLGMQINRSVWVAFSAITSVENADSGQIVLKLANGDEERVAKPRVFAFRQLYRDAQA